MSVALNKIPGVESAEVSLETGVADIRLAANNTTSIEAIQTVIRRGGYSPKEVWVRATARLVKRSAGVALVLAASGPALPVELTPSADAGPGPSADWDGKSVEVTGRLLSPSAPSGQGFTLRVESLRLVPE